MKMRRFTLPVLVLSLALLPLVIPSVSMLARVQAAANTGQYLIASAKAPPQEDCGTVVFSDDFSGSLSNWDVHSGTWTIQNGELKGVRTDGGLDSWIYAGNLAWTNYLLSATVDFDTGNGDLVVRSTGHFQNEYRIQVWSSNAPQYANRYQIYRYKNGVRSSLTAGKPGAVDGTVPAPILITDPANVQVKVIDNTLFLYINGTLIDTVTDTDPLPSGRIGLGVIWDWQGYFDDVVVYSCESGQPQPLTVVATDPSGNGRTIAPYGNISATFSRAIDTNTVYTGTFTVRGKQTGIYGGEYTFSSSSVQFDPTNEFNPGEEIVVNLSDSLMAADGMALTPYAWQFRTAVMGGNGIFIDSGQRLGNEPSSGVALGDLDGDGDLDAYVVNYDYPNTVWLNDGTGTFTDTGQRMGTSSGMLVTLGDVDSDGDLDAFVANYGLPNKVWLNNGSGTFTDSGQNLDSSATRVVALGDLDGDGDLDAFFANTTPPGDGADTVWLNDGRGNFTDTGQRLGNSNSQGLALGDLDRDGDLDAFVGNTHGDADEIWLNDGAGTFTNSGQILDTGYSTPSVALGDLDGDGDLDAFAAGGYNRVWLNDGTGVLSDSGQRLLNLQTYGVALGDLDGDNDLDAFTANGYDYAMPSYIWLNDGTGTFTDSGQRLGNSRGTNLDLGDLDGDGDLDAFIANFNADMPVDQANEVWLNGQGQTPPNNPPAVDAGGPYSVPEGSTVPVTSNGNDPDGDPLSYAWDLDNNGSFETTGQQVIFSAVGLDGPISRTITAVVTDTDAASATDQANVAVLNVAPMATFSNTSGTITEGETASLAFSNQVDPSAADTAAGFLYSYDCTNDGTFELVDASTVSNACAYLTYGTFTAKGRIEDKDGGYTDYTIGVIVLPSLTSPDLTLNSSEITFSPLNPDPGQLTTISAVITNQGLGEASDIQVSFFDFDTQIGQDTIPVLSAGASDEASIQASFPEASFRLIKVKVDPGNTIPELNEDNNEASQVLRVGQPDFSTAAMVVQASPTSTCQGDDVSVSGRADYDFASVPGQQDHPVQGGLVSVKVMDPVTSDILGVFTGSHTNVNGNFSQVILAPWADGTYPLLVEVTDKTVTGEIQTSLTVNGACPSPPPPPPPQPPPPQPSLPPPPGEPPSPVQDIYVFSAGIRFSQENPDPGEPIIIFAYIYYSGEEPVFNIPVTINDIFPVGGVLQKFKIGSSQVSFPNGESSSPVAISLPWTSSAEGAHVIQVVTEPPFFQFTGNDKATRLIVVGSPPLIEIGKGAILLVDDDGNGVVSPGDTLRYTINYWNAGASDITGAVIIDDYDEASLGPPLNISPSGSASEGTITWNLGTIGAGASGSVVYDVNIKSLSELPFGTTVVANTALLTSDQAATIAITYEVLLNVPPDVNAGPDQTAYEGDTVSLAPATFSDANVYDTHTATIDWGDGSPAQPGTVSETNGSGTVSGSHIYADEGDYTVQVCVNDGLATDCDPLTVTVANVKPYNIGLSLDPEEIDENGVVTLTGSFDDPGAQDQHTAVIDWGDGMSDTLVLPVGSRTFSASHLYLDDDPTGTPSDDYTVIVIVSDEDGESDPASTTVTVNNVAPTLRTITITPDPPVIEVGTSINASADFTDPSTADTHTALWDWNDGSQCDTSIDTDCTLTETSGSNPGSVIGHHTYTESGVYQVALTVKDDDLSPNTSVYQFVVVYDPTGGFVTGAGSIWSEAGWCQFDEECAGAEGMAHFGFVSKYNKGATVPTGNTGFKFRSGGLDFESDEYEWLVVNQGGTNAQYKGSGTINRELAPNGEAYKFMLWAGDGEPDTFRIKIWWEDDDTEHVVYDNGFDQAISGGNIAIHQAK